MGNKVEIELELEEEVITHIDALAEEYRMTRDEVVEMLLRDYLDSI